ncbi:PREDICTED: origin recognition complex subunit 3 [Ceratosolen solmsi marchali]|uniref:Origin recognition complex subunit 3 n=1 Tax=Ceratosolen solmsi marchali TaxID=326594 RepID=A0AAJ6YHK6_9HYME|nr:PREDICTED: origin recognition complex subunit 3 [Ceratosolen solmsi marchali]
MEDVSVSKGLFPYAINKFGKRKRNIIKDTYKDSSWYKVFNETWSLVENAATKVNDKTFSEILLDLKNFVTKVKDIPSLLDEIPTGILLAGVNLPDHNLLLQKIIIEFYSITPYVAMIWSRDANSLKNLIEEIVYQIINKSHEKDNLNCLSEVKRNNCTFYTLSAWYNIKNNYNAPIVIIIPDFESFSSEILHDFILILSSYLKTMKFILIFGVATSLHIVHHSLSYDATSKLKVQVFHTPTQLKNLSYILDDIVLSSNIPFKLTGRAFKLLVDIFLYYDFSVQSFLQSYKICMWKHFYLQNEKLLCCNRKDIEARVLELTNEDLRRLKNLPSVKNYIQSLKKSEINKNEFRIILINLLNDFHTYMSNFLIVLKCLYKLCINLPGLPFGKNFREIYAKAVKNINLCETTEYKKVIQLISFLSKEDLLLNIKNILSDLDNYETIPDCLIEKLKYHMNIIKDASLDIEVPAPEINVFNENMNRLQWKEKLKLKSLETRNSPYREAQSNLLNYLDQEVFEKYLKTPDKIPLNEIFCYNDAISVNESIKGSMKASIHNSLNYPNSVLECDCCVSNSEIVPTHPDLTIVYKLHLEARKMINLYDWLQSFLTVIDPNQSDEQNVDPVLHARFTRAVAELQFLGFIKATRKKTDHVKRLT